MLWLAAQLISGIATVGDTGLQFCQQKKGHPGEGGFRPLSPSLSTCGRVVANRGIQGMVWPFWGSAKPCPCYKVPEHLGVGFVSPRQGPCLPLVPVQEAGRAEPQPLLLSVSQVTVSVLLLSTSGDFFQTHAVPSPFSKPLPRWRPR